MLKQRIITALLLLAVLLPALFAAALWPFALLLLVMIGAAGWEWGRLNGLGPVGAVALGGLVAAGGLLAYGLGWPDMAAEGTGWWLATSAWVLGGAWILRRGVAGWPALSPPLRWMLGALLLWSVWLAMVAAKARGVNFLLSVFTLVWAADIAAYFGGRAFGRRKLAPAISPGKSWEGVWSGMAGVLVLALVWIALDRYTGQSVSSLYSQLLERLGPAGLTVALLFLTAMSVVGDLFESLVKRSAGAKDSSALLPGHGGVLDRIDALLPVFPLALALCSF
ncbi:phosphatidate cytidylyltransferase [Methylibium petroleiphilum]|uniref:Phosphatidate cytidylyltransferase n=1 Tax=Methylibium petroleiphilum (strain ATCC BAA-1232 / LMG 22953 / PM1) TaxID=420662 RepID=A2SH93_METPP|nr:phosphatidate cytidylyltransferase [Methylibium petroleiphilum]ABM94932.1 putative phosphatidate cytidylyltransferase membrane protein [Methylibium petroleiphilum PM1]